MKQSLQDFCAGLPIINTHSHFLDPKDEIDLDFILSNSYVSWLDIPTGRTKQEREDYIGKVQYNSYYVWLEKALRELYSLGKLSADNWDEYSNRIRAAYRSNPQHAYEVFKSCGYEKIILDAYWKPGHDHGMPKLFSPSYRVNMFFFGYSQEVSDHNGNNPCRMYGVFPDTLEEYTEFMCDCVRKEREKGSCAIKCAIAYDRGLDFNPVSIEKAARAYKKRSGQPTKEEIKDFQDYIFYELCKIAAELNLTLQCHTGLGLMERTGAIWLRQAIESNPDTRFSLMHGSYPYTSDLMGLIHNFKNVYADICWLPLLSTACAIRAIEELLDVAAADKICWGCDTWTAEESYGALLAIRYTLSKIAEKKMREGFWTQEDSENIIKRILYTNAKELFLT